MFALQYDGVAAFEELHACGEEVHLVGEEASRAGVWEGGVLGGLPEDAVEADLSDFEISEEMLPGGAVLADDDFVGPVNGAGDFETALGGGGTGEREEDEGEESERWCFQRWEGFQGLAWVSKANRESIGDVQSCGPNPSPNPLPCWEREGRRRCSRVAVRLNAGCRNSVFGIREMDERIGFLWRNFFNIDLYKLLEY